MSVFDINNKGINSIMEKRRLPIRIVLLKFARRNIVVLYKAVHNPSNAGVVRAAKPIIWKSGSSAKERAVKKAQPIIKADRFTRKIRTASNTNILCIEKRGVRPKIIAKQNPRLICRGSVSELSTFKNLAIS
jgi:hypothetical protein